MKKSPKEENNLLYESLLQLKDVEECRRFMQDLCTVNELKAMEQRIEVAMYLRDKIGFYDIYRLVSSAVDTVPFIQNPTLEEILEADRLARICVNEGI